MSGDLLPGPEAELAVLLMGTRQRRERAVERIATLLASVDQDAFAQNLIRQRIFPLAGSRLVEVIPAGLTMSFQRQFEEALTSARMRAMAFSALTTRVVQKLEQVGIAAVPLKGPIWAAELHGDEALRDYADIDVLVARQNLDRSSAIIRTLGWTEFEPSDGRLERLHRTLRQPQGSLPEVELHWRVHWYETGFAVALLEGSRVIDGVRRLDPVDQLAALLLFYARDGFVGLRLAGDIAAWWDQHGSSEVFVALEGLMAQHSALAEPLSAALAAATLVVGLPAEAASCLRRPRARRSALALHLSNWELRGDIDQIHANVSLIDGLLTPRGGLSDFVSRQLFWQAKSSRREVAVLRRLDRGIHVGKLLIRYLIALWGIRRGRWWSPPISAP